MTEFRDFSGRSWTNEREILTESFDFLLPLALNLTNRQYDIMLMDRRGVSTVYHRNNLSRLDGPTFSPAVFRQKTTLGTTAFHS